MSMEKMQFGQPEVPEPSTQKKEKSGLSKLAGKLKTTVGLGAAIVGIGLSEGNFGAQAADMPHSPNPHAEKGAHGLNDHVREEHFYDFTKHYTEAMRGFDRIKSPKDAEHVAVALDAVVKFLKASEWKTAGDKPALDKRYVIGLDRMEEMYQKLEQKYGVSFEASGRKAAFEDVRASFTNRLEEHQALTDMQKAEKKLPKSNTTNHSVYAPQIRSGNSVSFGTSPHSSDNTVRAPRLSPNRGKK